MQLTRGIRPPPGVVYDGDPIDVVYTWVDPSDPHWAKLHAEESIAPGGGVAADASVRIGLELYVTKDKKTQDPCTQDPRPVYSRPKTRATMYSRPTTVGPKVLMDLWAANRDTCRGGGPWRGQCWGRVGAVGRVGGTVRLVTLT